MGIINHNAIIATTWNTEVFEKVSEFTKNNHPNVFLLSDKQINGYRTIVLVPDGSKEGWPESDEFDDLRDRFIKKLESFAYDDGSNPWSWVEVSFGEYGQEISRGNNKNCFE